LSESPCRGGPAIPDLLLGVGEVFGTAVLVGAVESSMARLRLVRVPDLLLTAAVLAAVAFLWAWR
jgi:formate hydrogenlyase subunit 4